MNLLTNTRGIQPQILPQTETRLKGEQLVISFPKGWRYKIEETKKVTISSPTNEARVGVLAFVGFKNLSAFENWLFSKVHFHYREVGSALIQVPHRQIGIGRRLDVNNLDIVIKEFEDASEPKYIGVAGVRLRDVSVSVVFKGKWNAIAENRKIFENSVKSVRFISKNLL